MRASRRRFIVLLLGLLPGAGSALSAPVHFDFEPRAFVPGNHYIKDHSLTVHDGTFHIFYITGTDSLARWTEPGNEVDFGHATSADLRHWDVHQRVVDWGAQPWEARNRWAPHVLKVGDRYRMYYTGVNEHIAQAIGVAESMDLFDWAPVVVPPFYPDTGWARWAESSWSDCRDPFVFRHDSRWWMIYTATTSDRRGALGLASGEDGLLWRDEGPLIVGAEGESLESAQLVEGDGRWHLFFTSGRRGGTYVVEAAELRGPWRFETRRRWLGTVAPEFTQAGNELWVSTHAAYQHFDHTAFYVRFDEVALAGGTLLVDRTRRLGPGWLEPAGPAFEHQPIIDDRPWLRGEPRVGITGNGWVGTGENYSGEARDDLTGVARSRLFILSAPRMSLRVGGTGSPDLVYVALRRGRDDAVLFRETGGGSNALTERTWDTGSLIGEEVYVELADRDAAGHLNVDAIRELPVPKAPSPIGARPNPFRQSTTIDLASALSSGDRVAPSVTIYDAAGRRVVRLGPIDVGGWGSVAATWNGLDADGLPVAAGVYFARIATTRRSLVTRIVRLK